MNDSWQKRFHVARLCKHIITYHFSWRLHHYYWQLGITTAKRRRRSRSRSFNITQPTSQTRCSRSRQTSPRWRHLAIWTKHTRRLWLGPISLHYTETWRRPKTMKYITYRTTVRREPRPRVTYAENMVKFERVVSSICEQAVRQSNRHRDALITIIRTPASGEVMTLIITTGHW